MHSFAPNAGRSAKSLPPRLPLRFSLARFLVFAVGVAACFAYTADYYGPAWTRWLAAACFLLPLVGLPFRANWRNSLLAACLAFVVYVVSTTIDAPLDRRCPNNLSQIGRALLHYHSHYGTFPPADSTDANGRPMHSWRVLILPYLGRQDLYDAYHFNEPWNGPNNRKLHNVVLTAFNCPSDSFRKTTQTSYLALVGPQTLFPHLGTRGLADITDGSANSILLIEVHSSGIHWMEPRDISPAQYTALVRAGSSTRWPRNHPESGFVAFADGHVRRILDSILASDLDALMTIAGGEPVYPDHITP